MGVQASCPSSPVLESAALVKGPVTRVGSGVCRRWILSCRNGSLGSSCDGGSSVGGRLRLHYRQASELWFAISRSPLAECSWLQCCRSPHTGGDISIIHHALRGAATPEAPFVLHWRPEGETEEQMSVGALVGQSYRDRINLGSSAISKAHFRMSPLYSQNLSLLFWKAEL